MFSQRTQLLVEPSQVSWHTSAHNLQLLLLPSQVYEQYVEVEVEVEVELELLPLELELELDLWLEPPLL